MQVAEELRPDNSGMTAMERILMCKLCSRFVILAPLRGSSAPCPEICSSGIPPLAYLEVDFAQPEGLFIQVKPLPEFLHRLELPLGSLLKEPINVPFREKA